MKVKARYLEILILKLIQKHNESLERKALERIGDEIAGLTPGYLYKKIRQPISKLRADQTLGLRDSCLDAIAAHLGYNNMRDFLAEIQNPGSAQLNSLIGNYYSFVRRNTQEGVLLRSPVRIFKEKGRYMMELKGARITYTGEMRIEYGVLKVQLNSNEGKTFYHVYKIGSIEMPVVLQGIFVGTTSSFDPIGGRVVLERRDENYSDLRPAALPVSRLQKSENINERILAGYLFSYSKNNLSIGKTASFDFADLME